MNTRLIRQMAAPLLLLVCLKVSAGYELQDRVQGVRSNSFLIVSSILLSYDPFARTFDHGKRDDYLTRLATMAVIMDDPDLVLLKVDFDHFSTAIRDLDTRSAEVPLGVINVILDSQANLVARASTLYSTQPSERSKSRLHALSLASARMLILYQMRPYGGLVMYPGILLDEQQILALDAHIMAGLDAEALAGIDSIRRHYLFVRPRLFDVDKDFTAYGVNYYLGQNIVRLDALAGAL